MHEARVCTSCRTRCVCCSRGTSPSSSSSLPTARCKSTNTNQSSFLTRIFNHNRSATACAMSPCLACAPSPHPSRRGARLGSGVGNKVKQQLSSWGLKAKQKSSVSWYSRDLSNEQRQKQRQIFPYSENICCVGMSEFLYGILTTGIHICMCAYSSTQSFEI